MCQVPCQISVLRSHAGTKRDSLVAKALALRALASHVGAGLYPEGWLSVLYHPAGTCLLVRSSATRTFWLTPLCGLPCSPTVMLVLLTVEF